MELKSECELGKGQQLFPTVWSHGKDALLAMVGTPPGEEEA